MKRPQSARRYLLNRGIPPSGQPWSQHFLALDSSNPLQALGAHWLLSFWATLVAAVVVTLIGIPASTRVSRAFGLKDPQFIVIDEVAGQLTTLIGVSLAWKTFLAGFILFRVFDIWKPFPIRRLERLPEGTGIVVDDLGAGFYALVVMHLLPHFGLLMR